MRKITWLIAALPFISLFIFPWYLTLFLMFCSGLVLPALPLIAGVLADIVYHPGGGWYTGVLTGASFAVITYAVRHIYRTRIM